MILFAELLNFGLMTASQIANELFILITSAFERGLDNFKLSATFVQGIRSALELLPAGLQFKSELSFKVFLDTHAKDIRVYWQHHLLSEIIKVTLLPFDSLRHLSQSLFELLFEAPSRRHFIHKAFLVVGTLLLDSSKMDFEVIEQLVHLLFLSCCRSQGLLYGKECSLELVLFFDEGLGKSHIRWGCIVCHQ